MNTVEIRKDIIRYLEGVEDESFLKAIYSMLNTYLQEQADPIIAYDIDGTPKRANEMMEKYEADLEAVEQGHYITIEELEKESEKWLKPTK